MPQENLLIEMRRLLTSTPTQILSRTAEVLSRKANFETGDTCFLAFLDFSAFRFLYNVLAFLLNFLHCLDFLGIVGLAAEEDTA